MIIYGSLQAEFMNTKYNIHIHMYVIDISKPIKNNNQIVWRL